MSCTHTHTDSSLVTLYFKIKPFPFKSKLRKASLGWWWLMTPTSHPPFPDPGEMPEE